MNDLLPGSAPRFSVVVPAYNAADTLGETLDAVVAQTYRAWECAVVDDGSTDGTLALARSYAARDPRIAVIHQENHGTGGAYNAGVRRATGDWVTICSADDILLPRHLEAMSVAISCHPDYDIFSSNGFSLLPDGSRTLVYQGVAGSQERSWSLEDVLRGCFFSVGACYRSSLFDRLGGYREAVFGEDYDFWLRAMAAGARHLYIPQALAVYRVSATQKSANLVRSLESDIHLIGALIWSGHLSWRERRTARSAIRMRRQMIVSIAAPKKLSGRIWRLTMRVLSTAGLSKSQPWRA